MAGRKRGLGFELRRRGLLSGRVSASSRTRPPHFVAHGGTPEENIAAFVKQARDNPCWLGHVAFDEDRWDVTGSVAQRPGRPSKPHVQILWFCRARKAGGTRVSLPLCIKDFCKAVVRQTRGVRVHVLEARIQACKYLGDALEAEGHESIAGCSIAVLDAAVDLAGKRLGRGSASRVASQIQIIARFLNEHRMTSAPVGDWSPVRHGSALPAASDGRAERARDRLPTEGYIAALGEAFQLAVLDTDVIVTGILTLQLCGLGWRIDDVLNLPEDCDRGLDDGEMLALRCIGSKRVGPVVRDIPTMMTPLARSALAQIRRLTEGARAAKHWYDEHPTELYLPGDVAHLRAKPWLTMDEAAALIGLCPQHAFLYARRNGMELWPARSPKGGRSSDVSFASLQHYYLEQLPKRSRAAGGRDYHPLLLVQQGLFRRTSSRTGSLCMFQVVTHDHIRSAIMPKPGAPGIFRRLGVDRDWQGGDRTHPIRHFFATLARARHVSGDDLAHVQGRTDSRHDAHYEHPPDEAGQELLARVAADLALEGDSPAGPLADAAGLDAVAAALMLSQGLSRARDADLGDTPHVA